MSIREDNKEKLLNVLSKVPIASNSQLATLFQMYAYPEKEASRWLNQLLHDGLIEANYHGQERIWKLSKSGRKLKTVKGRPLKNIPHTLAVVDYFFKLQPRRWLFEPTHRFKYMGKERVWEPDFVAICEWKEERYFWAAEIQLTPLSRKNWSIKWDNYNVFFNSDHWKTAQYQSWFKKPAIPKFLVITQQTPENVKEGFNVKGRELIIRDSL